MRQIIIFIAALCVFLSIKSYAQLKPAQAQYFNEKGILVNPSFEQGSRGWITSGTCNSSILNVPYLNNVLSMGCTAANFEASQEVSYVNVLGGNQGLASFYYRSAESTLDVEVETEDGVQATITLPKTESIYYKKAELPFIIGKTSNKITIKQSTNFTGSVRIDGVSLGLAPDGYIQSVGQAHHVGSIRWGGTTNCLWTRNSTSFGVFSDDADCDDNARTIEGNVYDPTSGLKPHIGISNTRTDGTYRLVYQGDIYKASSTTNRCRFRLDVDGVIQNTQSMGASGGLNRTPLLMWDFKFTTTGAKEIELQAASDSGDNCHIDGRSATTKISVHFYPDHNATIISQETELTSKTANEFNIRLDNSTNPVITSYDYDIISSCTETNGTNLVKTCTYQNVTFTTAPTIQVTPLTASSSHDAQCHAITSTLVDFSYGCKNNETPINYITSIEINKQDIDVNKSQKIIGVFDRINSSPTVRLEVVTNDSQALTSGDPIPYKTERVDNYNAWDGDTFTAPFASWYIITGSVFSANAPTGMLYTIDTNTNDFVVAEIDGTTTDRMYYSKIIYMDKDDTFFIDGNNSYTLNASTSSHTLSVASLPDYEAIVKNLSNQKEECSLLYLTADLSSDGAMSDLTFSNLVIGKKYRIYSTMYTDTTTGTDQMLMTSTNNSITVCRQVLGGAPNSGARTNQSTSTCSFVAGSATLTHTAASINASNFIRGNGTKNETFVELCELPDSTIINSTRFE